MIAEKPFPELLMIFMRHKYDMFERLREYHKKGMDITKTAQIMIRLEIPKEL